MRTPEEPTALRPDTIVARATAPGPGALAVVRLSGSRAVPILEALLGGAVLPVDGRPALRWLTQPDDGRRLDRAVVTARRAPATYTGEDVVEISCHGGWWVAETIVDACRSAGARRAEPGEFSRRAYLNGKLDLLQAESTADLIEARSRVAQDVATAGLDRGLSERVAALRSGLIGLEALLVHHLDFPEEDDPPVPLSVIEERAHELEDQMRALIATAPEGELLKEGALTVLAGVPNAGKSSLFNALLGRERAIVTDVPGTTRDALEATAQIGGFPFLLVDTAGLRETADAVERKGVEVAGAYLDRARVVLFCVQAGRPLSSAEASFLADLRAPVVLVRTQADRAAAASAAESPEADGATQPQPAAPANAVPIAEVVVSAHSGVGLDRLAELLPALVFEGLVQAGVDQPVVTRRRQREALTRAASEVAGFREALAGAVPAEVAASHLRVAETALEELVGIIQRDDVLDRLFDEFCIGK